MKFSRCWMADGLEGALYRNGWRLLWSGILGCSIVSSHEYICPFRNMLYIQSLTISCNQNLTLRQSSFLKSNKGHSCGEASKRHTCASVSPAAMLASTGPSDMSLPRCEESISAYQPRLSIIDRELFRRPGDSRLAFAGCRHGRSVHLTPRDRVLGRARWTEP